MKWFTFFSVFKYPWHQNLLKSPEFVEYLFLPYKTMSLKQLNAKQPARQHESEKGLGNLMYDHKRWGF